MIRISAIAKTRERTSEYVYISKKSPNFQNYNILNQQTRPNIVFHRGLVKTPNQRSPQARVSVVQQKYLVYYLHILECVFINDFAFVRSTISSHIYWDSEPPSHLRVISILSTKILTQPAMKNPSTFATLVLNKFGFCWAGMWVLYEVFEVHGWNLKNHVTFWTNPQISRKFVEISLKLHVPSCLKFPNTSWRLKRLKTAQNLGRNLKFTCSIPMP